MVRKASHVMDSVLGPRKHQFVTLHQIGVDLASSKTLKQGKLGGPQLA